jgi:hypothetical protein
MGNRWAERQAIWACASLVVVLGGALCTNVARAETYYVSASGGEDAAAGTSESSAWKSLARVSQVPLAPGDQVRLAGGDQFQGMLTLDARGVAERPVVLDSYGQGRATIDGAGQEAAVRLVNPAHVIVRNLELTNPEGPYGVYLTARNAGALGEVVLEELDIHSVYQPAWQAIANAPHDEKKYYGGINAQVLRGAEASWWTGLVIRRCKLHDLGTCGISIGSDYPLHAGRRTRRNFEPFPILGVRIEYNAIHDIARDGAIVRQCRDALVQSNQVARTGRVSVSNGLWFWDCEASSLRYNVGAECGAREQIDGAPFSIDYFCQDCSIEFNYSHDNEGPGLIAFGNQGTGQGTRIRGNVSYNDATADLKPGFAAVAMVSTLSDTVVEGNVIVAGPQTRRMLGHHDWQGLPREVTYRGNVFVGNGRAEVEAGVVAAARFDGNLFIDVPNLPAAAGPPAAAAGPAFVQALAKLQQAMHATAERP